MGFAPITALFRGKIFVSVNNSVSVRSNKPLYDTPVLFSIANIKRLFNNTKNICIFFVGRPLSKEGAIVFQTIVTYQLHHHPICFGMVSRARTCDLLVPNQAFYQLNYYHMLCGWRDSNPHTFRHLLLGQARLPLRHIRIFVGMKGLEPLRTGARHP